MKTKKTSLSVTFLLFSFLIFTQNDTLFKRHVHVPYKYFKEYYSQKDSLGFLLKENDTLIKVKKFIKPKGVGVPYEPKDSTFLEVYKSLAFQPKKNKRDGTNPMKYWKKEIKIYFSGNISRKVKKEVLRFTKNIEFGIDSLSIKRERDIKKANYIIYTDKDIEYEPNIENTRSANYYVYWNNKNHITKGFLKINTSALFSETLQTQKIKENFIYSLGWFKLSNSLDCNSYFSNCASDNKRLSQLDLEILKYHYSYGICKGTDLKTFEEQHQRAKKSLENPHSKFVIYHQE